MSLKNSCAWRSLGNRVNRTDTPINVVSDYAGHKHWRTTKRYAIENPEAMREAVERYPVAVMNPPASAMPEKKKVKPVGLANWVVDTDTED
ncbi:hypothetical protein ACFLYO_02035 [Chloroflexota bacterium]